MFARFWTFARPYRRDYAAGFVYLLGTNILATAIPWLLRAAVHVLERREPLGRVAWLAATMAALALAQGWIRTRSRLRILGASRRAAFDIREAFFAHLQRLGAGWYDAHRTGDVMSRGVNDLQLLQALYGPGVMNVLNTAIIYVSVVVMMLWLDPALTAAALGLFPLLYFGVNRVSKGVYARSRAVQEQLADIANRAQENLGGSQQVKIYAQEEREIEAFRALSAEFRRRNLALARQRGLMIALIGAFSGCGTLLVLFAGGLRVVSGAMSFGDFVAFNAYLGLLAWPTVALGWIVNVFQRGAGAMERIDEVLSAAPDAGEADDGAPPLEGNVEIRGLTFTYPGASTPSLRDVTLTIPRGSRVAIVGPVGSGKSTLAHLLSRVYPAPPGTIRIGGADLASTPAGRVRRSVGLVPQEAFLFSRPLRENVAFGRPDADEPTIADAVRSADLEDDLPELPRGLDTIVGERGYTLSGGQRQRATLARAIVPEPRFLVLDDALASVDADTERAILAALQNGPAGRTLVLVTHRVATLASMDRIVVLDGGRVAEDGPHAELIARDGLYAKLFRRYQLEQRLDLS